VIAIVVAAFLFQPLRDWVQARLDHFFYRDRLDYRRTLIEFGRALTNEVRLEPLLVPCSTASRKPFWWIASRFSSRTPRTPDSSFFRAPWVATAGPLDLSFLDPARPAFESRLPVL
jgi:hypothetical protein